ncbi:MAG: prepilin-type N-terminal cleavage/methylation domain-containing protein [Myxococcota bacterium]
MTTAPRHPRTTLRGFTLLEVMVVISLVSILVAMGVPGLSPFVGKTKLDGETEAVAGLLAQARSAAMMDRRCVRVRVTGNRTLVAEKLNVYDCENPNSSPVYINGGGPVWLELDRLTLGDQLTVTWEHEPSETPGELRYRPTGRLFSSDTTLTDDDGVLRVTQSTLPSPINQKRILAEAHGPICVLNRGETPPGSAGNFSCP